MHHITSEERHTLEILLKDGKTANQIAKALNRHRSSILCEIKRNKDLRSGNYRCDLAHRKACDRKADKPTRCSLSPEILEHVLSRLSETLSSEQIGGVAKSCGYPVRIARDYLSVHLEQQKVWRNLLPIPTTYSETL